MSVGVTCRTIRVTPDYAPGRTHSPRIRCPPLGYSRLAQFSRLNYVQNNCHNLHKYPGGGRLAPCLHACSIISSSAMDAKIRRRLQNLGIASASLSIAVCTLSIICLLLLRLHTKSSYRLALYQVSSSLLFGVACFGAFFAFPENNSNTVQCLTFAFVAQYAVWVEIAFTVCLTLHLFCLSVFYKNMAKCERAYVLCSLLVPLALAIVPFITSSYGPAEVWCWIQNWKLQNNTSTRDNTAEVEQFVLLYGPAFVILVACSGAVITMGLILACRAFTNVAMPITSGQQQHQQLLKQLLPIIVYPILFFLFFLVPFTNRIYTKYTPKSPQGLIYATVFFVTSWSTAPGVALLVHMIIIFSIARRRRGCCQRKINYVSIDREGTATRGTTRRVQSEISETYYSIPVEI